jgi:hypothetical protein
MRTEVLPQSTSRSRSQPRVSLWPASGIELVDAQPDALHSELRRTDLHPTSAIWVRMITRLLG